MERLILVRQEGLEPPPLGLEGRCSIQLSYCRVLGDAYYARYIVRAALTRADDAA